MFCFLFFSSRRRHTRFTSDWSSDVCSSDLLAWQSLKTLRNFSEIVGGRSGFVKTGYLVIVDESNKHGLENNISMQQSIGINCRLISPEECRDIAPMVSIHNNELIAWEPESGYADSYQVTASFANAAKQMGAEITLRNPVQNIRNSTNDLYSVVTEMGTIETPVVVRSEERRVGKEGRSRWSPYQ